MSVGYCKNILSTTYLKNLEVSQLGQGKVATWLYGGNWGNVISNLGAFIGSVRSFHMIIRDLPRFFDEVGHQTTNASIENKHFFTK